MLGVNSNTNHEGTGGEPPGDPDGDAIISSKDLGSLLFNKENMTSSGKWASQTRLLTARKCVLDPSSPASTSDVSLLHRIQKNQTNTPMLCNVQHTVKQILQIDLDAVVSSHKSKKMINEISEFPKSEKEFNEFFTHHLESEKISKIINPAKYVPVIITGDIIASLT